MVADEKFIRSLKKWDTEDLRQLADGDLSALDRALERHNSYLERVKKRDLPKFDGSEEDLRYAAWFAAMSPNKDSNLLDAFARGAKNILHGVESLAASYSGARDIAIVSNKVFGTPIPDGLKVVDEKGAKHDPTIWSKPATAIQAVRQLVSDWKMFIKGGGLLLEDWIKDDDNSFDEFSRQYRFAVEALKEQKDVASFRERYFSWLGDVANAPIDAQEVEVLSEVVEEAITSGTSAALSAGKSVSKGLVRKALKKSTRLDDLVSVFKSPIKQLESTAAEVGASKAALAQVRDALASAYKRARNLPPKERKRFIETHVSPLETYAERLSKTVADTEARLGELKRRVAAKADTLGVSIPRRVVGSTLQRTGQALEKAGDALSSLYRHVDDKTGGVVSDLAGAPGLGRRVQTIAGAGVGAVLGGPAGAVAGAVLTNPKLLSSAGRNVRVLGELYSVGESSLPYFRLLRHSKELSGWLRASAAVIDGSHIPWALAKTGKLTKSTAAGVLVSGGFGYVASGGDLEAAAESAGGGMPFAVGGTLFGQWAAYAHPELRAEELLANRRAYRNILSSAPFPGATSQLDAFDALPLETQVWVASYALANPDVQFRFTADESVGRGSYNPATGEITISVRQPHEAILGTVAHELGHFAERHGLTPTIRDLLLGNPKTNTVGAFTKIGEDGKPVTKKIVLPNGEEDVVYALSDEGESLKQEYLSKLAATPGVTPDMLASFSDLDFAREVFAEAYANQLLRRKQAFIADLKAERIGPLFGERSMLRTFLGKAGLLFNENDEVVGTGLFSRLKSSPGLRDVISRYNRLGARNRLGALDTESTGGLSIEDLRNKDVVARELSGGGVVMFDADGKPVFDADGKPHFLTAAQANRIQKDLANEIIIQLERWLTENPDADPDVLRPRKIREVTGKEYEVYVGRWIPEEVVETIRKQRRFNPHVLNTIRLVQQAIRTHGPGVGIVHSYAAASSKGSRGYKTVGTRWRTDAAYGLQLTKDGNLVILSASKEQLFENAKRAARRKAARELWGDDSTLERMLRDLSTYLSAAAEGRKPSEVLGRSKASFLNELFGIRMASNADVNPFFDVYSQSKTILTKLRADRMNRVTALDTVEMRWGPEVYEAVKQNLRPEEWARNPKLAEAQRNRTKLYWEIKDLQKEVLDEARKLGLSVYDVKDLEEKVAEAPPEIREDARKLLDKAHAIASAKMPRSQMDSPGNTIRLVHLSHRALDVVDPNFQGTGRGGAELNSGMPDVRYPHWYVASDVQFIEPMFNGAVIHTAEVPKASLARGNVSTSELRRVGKKGRYIFDPLLGIEQVHMVEPVKVVSHGELQIPGAASGEPRAVSGLDVWRYASSGQGMDAHLLPNPQDGISRSIQEAVKSTDVEWIGRWAGSEDPGPSRSEIDAPGDYVEVLRIRRPDGSEDNVVVGNTHVLSPEDTPEGTLVSIFRIPKVQIESPGSEAEAKSSAVGVLRYDPKARKETISTTAELGEHAEAIPLRVPEGRRLTAKVFAERVRQSVQAIEFHRALLEFQRAMAEKAAKTGKPDWSVAVEIKPLSEYMKPGVRLFLAEDKMAGAAVIPPAPGLVGNDLVSVFRNPKSKEDIGGLLERAVAEAHRADAFASKNSKGETHLINLYAKKGLYPVARLKFNPEYKPEGWDLDTHGQPDVVFLAKIDPRAAKIRFRGGHPDLSAVPEVETYEDGQKAQVEALQNYGVSVDSTLPPIRGARPARLKVRWDEKEGLLTIATKSNSPDVQQYRVPEDEKLRKQLEAFVSYAEAAAADPTAIIPRLATEKDGTIKTSNGKLVVESTHYALSQAPLPKRLEKKLEGAKRKELLEVRKKHLTKKLVNEVKRWRHDPEVVDGVGWYGRMRTKLREVFGDKAGLFSTLLAATSANTPVDLNFRYAMEAYDMLTEIEKHPELESLLKWYVDQLEAEGAKVDPDPNNRDHLNKVVHKETGEEVQTTADQKARQIGKLPVTRDGAKFGMNGAPLLRAMLGIWLATTKGPKTKNFARNLSGDSFAATIDVWAARVMRRIGYGDMGARWRITPAAEKAVSDADFAFAQDVFALAAAELGMQPDDLQALAWFGEKKLWAAMGWTKSAGAALSSFDTELELYYDMDTPTPTRRPAEVTKAMRARRRRTNNTDETEPNGN